MPLASGRGGSNGADAKRNRMPDLSRQLREYFVSRGCDAPQIGLLQPADPLLDTAGEDLRRRIFMTSGLHGENLCLRPEFTIPVCLHHLENADGPARYAYAGTVFRQRADEPAEFPQAGIEDIGNSDVASADIAALTDCTQAMHEAGLEQFRLTLGDQKLFEAVLASLGLPKAWQLRLGRAFGDPAKLSEDVGRLSSGNGSVLGSLPRELVSVLNAGSESDLAKWISGRMEQSGLPVSGGRTASEIAGRLLAKAELAAASLDRAHRSALEEFLKIETPISEAPSALQKLAGDHDLDFGTVLADFAARVAAMDAAGLAGKDVIYKAGFGRRLDYYTGLVFEISVPGTPRPVAGGGRYDRLMSLLGASEPIPAVGFSIWLDRLAAARQAA